MPGEYPWHFYNSRLMNNATISILNAILTISISAAVNKKKFTLNIIEGCFKEIAVVKNAADTIPVNLAFQTCASAQVIVRINQYILTAADPILETDPFSGEDEVFCCSRLLEIQPSATDYSTAPFAIISGHLTTHKYRILPEDIGCHPVSSQKRK